MKLDDKMTTKELQEIKITDLKQGHELVAEIDRRRSDLLYKMQHTGAIPDWQKLSDERYDLFSAKKQIQNQMGKLVRSSDPALNKLNNFFGG